LFYLIKYMNTSEIKGIIQDQEREREKLLTTEKIIERESGKDKALNALKSPNIFTVLGVRRCGKSVLSHLILKDKEYGYMNFDDEALYGIRTKDLNIVLKSFYELYGTDLEYIILDEIQNVEGWELFVSKLRRTKKVVITGSNSRLLSGELATHLTGRHIDFTLFPFSFREFLTYNDVSTKELKEREYSTDASAIAEKMLEDYLSAGGFPEAHKFGGDILKSIFGDVVVKDVVRRYRIRNITAIEALAGYLVSNSSNEMTYNKLKNIFDIKKINTIKNYVRYLQETYLVFIVERFSFKLKQQIISPKKVYCIDTGIIDAISFKSTRQLGNLMENLVAIELQRKKSYLPTPTEVYYWKDHQQREVDFIVKEGSQVKELIQVCYDISDPETKKRELNALIKASKELSCNNLQVLTWDYEAREEFKNREIGYIPLWKWLLQ
jgi:predicted AAA+ superfamily ATPase